MNDNSNVVVLRRSALIIDLKMYVRNHYSKIRKALIIDNGIGRDMRIKLLKRIEHCYRITNYIGSLDHDTYHFSLTTTKQFGDPLSGFIPSWIDCEGTKLVTSVNLDYTLTLAKPPTSIAVDNRLFVQ
jgi:hypothetical protein